MALVLRLRDERPIEIRGAAMTARLLNDRGSPLHRDSAQELQAALRATRAGLDEADCPAWRRRLESGRVDTLEDRRDER